MSWVAVAVGGGAVIGGVLASNAAGDAADKQAEAAKQANETQWNIFQQQRQDQAPWREAGATALSALANGDFQKDFGAGDFLKDPGYDFRLKEGANALERSAAAKGGLMNGGTLKALSRYGQDYAANEFGNAYNRFNADRDRRFNRLSAIAGVGQTANSQVGQAGQNYAANVGANTMGAANAQGAAGIAQANSWGNTLSGLGNTWMNYQMMNKMFPKAT